MSDNDLIRREVDNECIKRGDVREHIQRYLSNRNRTTTELMAGLYLIPPAVDVTPVVRCKDCKHRIVNEHYGEKGYLHIKAMCDLDTDDVFELGRNAEDDDWYCADGERRE